MKLFATALGAAILGGCAFGGAQNAPNAAPAAAVVAGAKAPQDLYVADFGADTVDLFSNTSYKSAGTITDGIDSPGALFLDRQGQLYVANIDGADVTEYAAGSTGEPSFKYSAGMHNPYSVTTDAHGNVFEGDLYGYLNEYAQGVDKTIAACTAPGTVFGMAVDASGDVFVDYFGKPLGPANLVEYRGGLSASCSAKTLTTNSYPGGIALDKNGKLLVAEGTKVVVIDPAHPKGAAKIGSRFSGAIDVRLNGANTEAFVTDNSNDTVTVVSYPAGKNLKVLGSKNGLKSTRAAVDSPNAVY
ncbi:MAG TPA: hypothetical protein VGX91_06265 [Candidatus Cybelea sp.]|jgi:hypothetical protein|nr:hypothetical protein [Candidatus Cybelea sp.]